MSPPEKNLPPSPTPLARGREKQIMPGVYFTPPPTSANLHSSSPVQRNVHEMSLQELRIERKERVKSLEMLISSNEAMREMNPKNEDKDLVDAVGENCEIIVRGRRRLHDIEARIAELAPAPCEGVRSDANESGMFL